MIETNDTICALATAPGGAIAIIRVSGKNAINITNNIFSKDLSTVSGYTLHYGEIANGIDQVVVSVYRSPHSYTGEDCVEISCHGSIYIIQKVLEELINQGARQAEPGEFTKRAFLNGKMDLAQAESIADLIASRNKATHAMAMSQLKGRFSNELEELRSQLLQLTSLLELELDFSEQDVEFADRNQLTSLTEKIRIHLEKLTKSFQTGNAIKNGVPVAIIGAPNVGKSTLLNALLHEDKAIVSNIQGTTRDTIEDTIVISGITFRFIDTAGIRKTRNKIEKIGIERSLSAAEKAQIIILLSEEDIPFPEIKTAEEKPILKVINKCDNKLPSSSFLFHKSPTDNVFHISAMTGDGLPLLEKALVEKAAIPEISENDTVVTNIRHYETLSKTLDCILRIQQSLQANIPSDLIAEDLRECLTLIGQVTGTGITNNEVLHNIFQNFCIGK